MAEGDDDDVANMERHVLEAKYKILKKNEEEKMKKVHLSAQLLKVIITTKSVRINLFHIVMSGLPWSGKSNLVKKILPSKDESKKIKDGLQKHEAILSRNLLHDDAYKWIDISKFHCENIFTASSILAYFFARYNQLPKFEFDSTTIDGIFEDDEVKKWFETAYSSLRELITRPQNESNVEDTFTGALSFVNIFDIGIHKAVHEFVTALGSWFDSFLLVNVLDISRWDDEKMRKPLKFDEENYYGTEKDQEKYQSYDAWHHFMFNMKAASMSIAKTSTVIVGTYSHEEENSTDTSAVRSKARMIMDQVKARACDSGIHPDSFLPEMRVVDMSKEEDCKTIEETIIELMKLNTESFEVKVPVRFIFLREVLLNTRKLFISRTELSDYAKKISIITEEEVESFLKVFRGCGSIISSPVKTDFLYSYVILLPIKFIRGLNKMYCVPSDTSLPDEVRKPTEFGIVSEELVRSVWQGPVEGSLTPSELYVSVLKNVGLMMDLKGKKYFMPSLRKSSDTSNPKPGSLFITTNLPVFQQGTFLKHLLSRCKDTIELIDCSYYNLTMFDWWTTDGQITLVSVKVNGSYIQISVDKPYPKICSAVKTVCVAVMNSIADFKPSLRHELCIVCPDMHFVPFDVLDSSIMELKCQKCSKVISEPSELEWIKCAYTGTRRSASHSDDLLIPANLLKICKQLSSLSIDDIAHLAEKMEVTEQYKQHKSIEDVLFCVLYNWHCKNPSATKKTLAKVLNECKYHDKAVAMDPTLFGAQTDKKVYSTELSSKQLLMISDSWSSGWKELNDILKVSASDLPQKSSNFDKCFHLLCKWMKKTDGDKIGKLAQLFKEEEYHNMSDLILTFHF